jgi:4-hydroxy-tetrahydrodipicolinate synthase
VVSVVSNVFPAGMTQLAAAMLAGDVSRGRALHRAMLPFFSAAFIESNPIPAKAVLAERGVMQNVLRSPLVPLAPGHSPALQGAVREVHDALALLGVAS